MKTKTLILSIFTFILFTGLKSQTLPVNGHFVNGNNEKIKADYILSCEGKVIDTGKALEELRLDLTVNKVYVLKVTNDNFKSKTICFSYKCTRCSSSSTCFFKRSISASVKLGVGGG